MILRNWLYYITKEDGRSGKVVNDVVTYTGTPSPLPNTPDGWQSIAIGYERPLDKHGLVTSFTLPLGFVRNGARIIRDALYKNSIEEKLFLLIQRLNLDLTLTNFKWVYRYFFKGEIDLSQVDDGQDILSVPVMEGGLNKLVKANWQTNYEFAMNDPICVNLLMDGIRLKYTGNFVLIDDVEIDNTSYGDSSWAPFSFLSQDGSSVRVAFFTQTLENTAGVAFADRLQSPNFFAKSADVNSGSIDVRMVGKIVYHCTEQDAANGFRMRFLRSGQNVGNQNDYALFLDTPLVQGETYSHDIDITIPLAPGERLYLEMILGNTGVDTKIKFDAESKLSAEYEFMGNPTYVKCYKRFDLFKKLIGKITGNEDYAVSELCTEFNSLLITCGDAIRGIETATLKTSLADFYQDTDATLMAGMYIKSQGGSGRVEIEDRLKYYTEQADVDAINLGEALDMHTQPAIDLLCNTYKFGHEKQNIEDINGKYDPNGTNQFTGPLTKVTKEYNAVSPYKAGPYEIELIRINLDGKTTTDDNRDNDVYVIAAVEQPPITATVTFVALFNGMFVEDATGLAVGQKIQITGSGLNDGVYDIISITSLLLVQLVTFAQSVQDESDQLITIEFLYGGYYTLNRPAYTTLEGVPNDTIFNLPYLTPKAMLLRHKRWIAGINYGLGSKKITFTSGKDNKNTELLTVLDGVTIDEDKDESISSFGEPMFLPYYQIAKFNPLTMTPEDLEENSNRSFIFTDIRNNEWRGFLRIAGIAPNDYTPQEFKLLMSPNNTLNLLIHG